MSAVNVFSVFSVTERARNATSTLRFGSNTSSSKRSAPRTPTPSSCGAIFPPASPMRWHAAQCLVNSFAPSSLSGFALANPAARVLSNPAMRWSAAGRFFVRSLTRFSQSVALLAFRRSRIAFS